MVGFMDGAIYENQLYFMDRGTGVLFQYSMNTKELQYTTSLYEDGFINFIPRRIFYINNRLYGISNNGYEVFDYRLGCKEDKNCTTYALDRNRSIVIKEAFLIGNQIWGIPTDINKPILIFEIDNNKTFLYKSIKELLSDDFILENGELEVIKYKEGMFSFTIKDENLLVEYQIEAKKSVIYNIDKKIIIGAFEYEGDNVWFRSKEGIALHKWNREAGFIESYELDNEDELVIKEQRGKLIKASNGRLILLPVYSNTVFYFDKETKSLKSVSGMEGCAHLEGSENGAFSIGNIECQGKLWLLPWASSCFVEIDIDDMKANCYKAKISENDEMNLYRSRWSYNLSHMETNYFTLDKHLSMLTNERTLNKSINGMNDTDETIGKKIFQSLEV